MGDPIVGWLDAHAGEAEDDPRSEGRRQVRDAPAESVEALVVVRRADDTLILPPWVRPDGGRELPTGVEPPPCLVRRLAACTLSLPIQLCSMAAIDELERNYIDAWQQSGWLEGELVLILDEKGEAQLAGYQLRYDRLNGLLVTRM